MGVRPHGDGMKVTLLHIGAALFVCAPVFAATGQDADESALDALDNATPPPVIKQEPAGAADLRPSDTFALTDAGYAAIKLGDYDAAFNFFSKADKLKPADARIKAGLATAQVRRENPFEALSLFDEAVRLGGNERSFAIDRALAYDLLGNFERAEKDYALAKSWADNEELTLRHAISASLAGRRDDADRMLIPMLQKENPEAWRARALMLAARGDHKEAGKIAAGFLEEREARRMDGYFRNMPKLTVAQQAAAMHFGHFPVGSNIGSDSEQLATLAAATGAKPVPQGDSRLIPTGEPLGTKTAAVKPKKPAAKDKKGKGAGGELATASAQMATNSAATSTISALPVGQLPAPEAARPPVRIILPAFTAPKPAIAELPAVGPSVDVAKAETPQNIAPPSKVETPPALPVKVATATADIAAIPVQPGFETISSPVIAKAPEPQRVIVETAVPPSILATDSTGSAPAVAANTTGAETAVVGNAVAETAIAETAAVGTAVAGTAVAETVLAETTVTPPPVVMTESSFDLGALVNAIEIPEDEKRPSVTPVDLSKIKTAPPSAATPAAKGELPAKAAKVAANTPRIFVQVATGADMNGLGFDYRRMAKKYGALFAAQDGWTAAWGKTRRLLVGPFPDLKSAKKWEADFRKAGGDGFVWQSDKNTEVEKLKGK
jgi:Flp pilus assembly protein TadD